MEQFFSIILGILVFFYLFGIIGKWLLRYWLSKKIKQFGDMGSAPNGGTFYKTWSGGFGAPRQEPQHKEGDVIIEKPVEPKKVNKQVGEYVDYEEIK